jgi:hypothetical protein
MRLNLERAMNLARVEVCKLFVFKALKKPTAQLKGDVKRFKRI